MQQHWRVAVWMVLFMGAMACGTALAQKNKEAAGFHPASSPVETLVDKVLRLSEKEQQLLEYVLHTPQYDAKNGKDYARYFTKRLLDDMAAMSASGRPSRMFSATVP